MPPFPEKESSGLLNLLKRKRPGRVPDNPGLESSGEDSRKKENGTSGLSLASHQEQEGGSVDLLGLGNGPSVTTNGSSTKVCWSVARGSSAFVNRMISAATLAQSSGPLTIPKQDLIQKPSSRLSPSS